MGESMFSACVQIEQPLGDDAGARVDSKEPGRAQSSTSSESRRRVDARPTSAEAKAD